MNLTRLIEKLNRRIDGKATVLSASMALIFLLSIILGLFMDHGGEPFTISFALVGCLALIIVAFCMPQANRICLITLAVSAGIMIVGAWINMRGYTHDTFTLANPDFHADDPFDSWREFELAKYITLNGQTTHFMSGNNSYPLMVSVLFSLFGINIIWPIALNMGFSLGSITLGGALCAKLMPEYGRRNMAMCGMILTAAVSGIIMHGTLLLKDAPVIFGVSLFAYALALAVRNQFNTRAILCAAGAAFVLLFSRPMVAAFLVPGVVLLCIHWSRKTHTATGLGYGIYYALLLFAVLMFAKQMIGVTANMQAIGIDNGRSAGGIFLLPTVQRYGELLPGYFDWPMWRRLLWLPFVCAAQYFPPFPWNFTRDLWMGDFYWYAHIPIGWYVMGGLVIAFFIFSWWRGKSLSRLNLWALWWLLCYIGIALYCAGTVPRYYLPFIPAAAPMAACVLHQVRDNIISRRNFAVYSVVYILMLGAGLIAAYIYLNP